MRALGGSKVVTARKNYGCDACVWITESGAVEDFWFLDDLSFAEKRAIVKARRNGWRVMKGEKHITQTLVSCDGKIIYTWRAIIDINALNHRHDVYQDAEVC